MWPGKGYPPESVAALDPCDRYSGNRWTEGTAPACIQILGRSARSTTPSLRPERDAGRTVADAIAGRVAAQRQLSASQINGAADVGDHSRVPVGLDQSTRSRSRWRARRTAR